MALILLVDDDEMILMQGKELLKNSSHRLETAKDAVAAYKLLQKRKYDLIITDLDMPMVTGLEFIAKIQDQTKKQETLIAVLSSTSETSVVKQALELGVSDYIVKPLKAASFLEKIESILLRQQAKSSPKAIAIKSIYEAFVQLPGQITDVSPKGVTILSPYRLDKDQEVLMASELFHELDIAPPLLKVVSCKAAKKGTWKAEVEFLSISAQTVQKIKNWCIQTGAKKKASS